MATVSPAPAMTAAAAAVVFGCTGLVGSHILTAALGLDAFSIVHTVSRRPPKVAADPKLHAVVDPDTAKWASQLAGLGPAVVFSALGTTRAQAGSIDAQWKIDHDLNVELAGAARAAGARTYVVVSSAGTRGFLFGRAPYSRMKVGVEDAVRDAGFEQAIIVRPGLLLGEREKPDGMAEGVSKSAVGLMTRVLGRGVTDMFAQDGTVVGRAAVRAAALAAQGKAPDRVWVLEQADIVRLGRDEWEGHQQEQQQQQPAGPAGGEN